MATSRTCLTLMLFQLLYLRLIVPLCLSQKDGRPFEQSLGWGRPSTLWPSHAPLNQERVREWKYEVLTVPGSEPRCRHNY